MSSWISGFSQEAPEIVTEYSVRIPLPDGVHLAADVIRPRDAEPLPALLLVTPYDRTRLRRTALSWARRDYAVVTVDARGTFASEGEYVPYLNEGRDAYAVQEWLGEQVWCNGNVGMWGKSYPAFTEVFSATHGSPHLKAIVPISAQADNFSNPWYTDGALHQALAYRGALLLGGRIDQIDVDAINWNALLMRLPLETALEEVGLASEFVSDVLRHSTYDDFWRRISVRERYTEMEVPALHVSGWYDDNVHDTIENFVNMREHSRSEHARRWQHLILGPWGHDNAQIAPFLAAGEMWDGRYGDVDFGDAARLDMEAIHFRWYDRLLKGVENGLDREDPIRIFVMGENVWRSEKEWPIERAQPTSIYLHSRQSARSRFGDGRLDSDLPLEETPDVYRYDPRNPVPTYGGNQCCTGELTPNGPLDQRAKQTRQDVLVYTTVPLESDTEVTGAITLRLFFSTDVTDTDFFAAVTDVHPDGRAILVAEGLLRARFRTSLEEPSLLVPGTTYEVEIPFWETSNVFRKGHRIRLHLTSSNFPRYARNLNSGQRLGQATDKDVKVATIRVLHDAAHPSALTLPVIPRSP